MEKYITIRNAVGSYKATDFSRQRDFINHLISYLEEGNQLAKSLQDRAFLNPGVQDIGLGMSDLASSVARHADKVRELGKSLSTGFLSYINSFVLKGNASIPWSYLYKPYPADDYVSNILGCVGQDKPDLLLTSMVSLSDLNGLGWISESEFNEITSNIDIPGNDKYFMAYAVCSYDTMARFVHTMFVGRSGDRQIIRKFGEMGEVLDYHSIEFPTIRFDQTSSARNGVTEINGSNPVTKYWPYPAGVIVPVWSRVPSTFDNKIIQIESNFLLWLAFSSLFADQPRLLAKLQCMREMYNDVSELILSFANAGFTESSSQQDTRNWVTNFIRSNFDGACYYPSFVQFSANTDQFLHDLAKLC